MRRVAEARGGRCLVQLRNISPCALQASFFLKKAMVRFHDNSAAA